MSGGHLAAAPGTVCGQPVSHAGPQIAHFSARRGVVSACVGVVFTHHPRCDDGPCSAPPEEEPTQKKEPRRHLLSALQAALAGGEEGSM